MMSTMSEFLEQITFFKSYVTTRSATKTKRQDERQELIDELEKEIANETGATELKAKIDEEQMLMRSQQLKVTLQQLEIRKCSLKDYELETADEEEWFQYMNCDGLPDASILPELNTFYFMWSLNDSAASMKTLPRQCEIVIYLIKRMDEIIAYSLKTSPNYIQDCKQIRQKFRDKLANWIDMASYCLLRQIERDTMRIDLRNAKYVSQLVPLVCCFWAFVRLPIGMKQISEKDKKAMEVTFDEVGMTVKMPVDLDCYSTAVRILWLGYDHYSDLSDSYDMPRLSDNYVADTDLLDFSEREHETLTAIRADQRDERERRLEEKRALVHRLLHPPSTDHNEGKSKKSRVRHAKDHEAQRLTRPVQVYLPTPEEIVLQREDEMRKETRRLLFNRLKKTEVNLRKYAILGGLYLIDLIKQPPQPKDTSRDTFLTTLLLPKELEFVNFLRPYKTPIPAPDAERTPEVIEAEIKALEAAMELLVLVTLKLPSTVVWFEPPLVAHWLPERRVWSTDDVHDIKYNEEKQIITFRTSRLGAHALAGYRFVNLPFQSWELKPEKGGAGVVLGLTGSIIQLEFLVREDLVSLHSIGGSAPLRELKGQFMKLNFLIDRLRAAGCDFFPEADAASYLKGVAAKHTVTVKHLQACMGLLSRTYIFCWSRWNATRGPREIITQIKEVHGCIAKQSTTSIMLVTPSSTSIVKCVEVSPEFTTEPASDDDKFYADVYHYALHHAGIKTRLVIKNTSFKLSSTVTSLLEAANIINMSA